MSKYASLAVHIGVKFDVKKENIKCVHEKIIVLLGILIVERKSRLPTNEIAFPMFSELMKLIKKKRPSVIFNYIHISSGWIIVYALSH